MCEHTELSIQYLQGCKISFSQYKDYSLWYRDAIKSQTKNLEFGSSQTQDFQTVEI